MKRISKFVLVLVGAVFATVLIAGCNTMQGMGEDISAGGKALSSSAEKAK
jgi:predicted small secreted protein